MQIKAATKTAHMHLITGHSKCLPSCTAAAYATIKLDIMRGILNNVGGTNFHMVLNLEIFEL